MFEIRVERQGMGGVGQWKAVKGVLLNARFRPDSGCTDFRTGRYKPVTELCKSNVGFVAMISTIAAPAPDTKRTS